MRIAGKTVIVTGASGGLGQAIARRFFREGAKLILTGRRAAELEALAEELNAEIVIADLCDQRDLDRLITETAHADVLIANAGTGDDVAIASETPENIDRVIDTNLRAPMQMSTAFAQRLIAEGRPGHIVFVGSLSGLAPTPNTRLYNASKFGLRGFSLALRQDVAEHGIGVSIVEPSFIKTAGMFAENAVELPKAVRLKSPEDVAQAVLKAVQKNTGESFVAPVELRAAVSLAVVAPNLTHRILDLAGAKSMKQVD